MPIPRLKRIRLASVVLCAAFVGAPYFVAMPGVKLTEVRKVMSHPVALSQCRRFLAAHPEIEVVPFYDTAGSVKHLMTAGLREVAGIAPELAAREYGAEVVVPGVEDHAQNYTRFHLLRREDAAGGGAVDGADKMSLAFAIEHRPGTLVATSSRANAFCAS